ncbi:CheY-like chemotaxis protein [Mycobacterium sp. OTB74]|jgi:CheY-like chemotaxis protein|nr:CheY-like chemotaxis protein [Mycobacterium sp. OTB74]
MNSRVWHAWVVDDNLVDSKRTSNTLDELGFEVVALHAEDAFIRKVEESVRSKDFPDLVVLDLRLPWSSSEQLADDALADGLRCVRTLRSRPGFAHTAVLIYSAFVKHELVESRLREFKLAHVIDKRNPEDLTVVVSNLFPNTLQTPKSRAGRTARWAEAHLLRISAIVAAVSGIGGFILWVWHQFH